MKNVSKSWTRLGSADAISAPLVLAVSTLLSLGSLVAPFVDVTDRLPEFLCARLLSCAAMAVVLATGKLLMRRVEQIRTRAVLTILTFILASVVLTIAMNLFLILTRFTNEWTIPRRLAVAVPGAFTFLVITALLVTYARELSRSNVELAARAAELRDISQTRRERIDRQTQTLIDTVKRQIVSEMDRIRWDSGRNAAAGLTELVDNVVRPLSMRLSRNNREQPEQDVNLVEARISWTSLIRAALSGNPLHPIVTSLWLGALLGSFLVPGFGLNGLFSIAVNLALTFAVLSLVFIAWSKIPNGCPIGVRVSVFSVTTLVATIAPLPAVSYLTGYSFFVPHVFLGWVSLSFLVSWSVTLVFAVTRNLKSANAQLNLTVNNLTRELVSIHNESQIVQRKASRIVHGEVQQMIVATLLRIESASTQGSVSRSLAELQLEVSQALDMLNHPVSSNIDINMALDEMADFWSEVVDIKMDLLASSRTKIERDGSSATALIEIIREACGNAIWHGHAKNIKIMISVDDLDEVIQLEVENDGHSLPAVHQGGLGSLMLDEMCLSWTRSQIGQKVRLDARLPLNI